MCNGRTSSTASTSLWSCETRDRTKPNCSMSRGQHLALIPAPRGEGSHCSERHCAQMERPCCRCRMSTGCEGQGRWKQVSSCWTRRGLTPCTDAVCPNAGRYAPTRVDACFPRMSHAKRPCGRSPTTALVCCGSSRPETAVTPSDVNTSSGPSKTIPSSIS